MKALFSVFALILAVSACGWMPEQEPTTEVFDSSGALCFTSKADGSVTVTAIFDTCLSSSCSRVLGSTCKASESAGVITVSSHAAVDRGGTECTADCGTLTARCEAPPLAPGTYTVKYGGAESDLTLPASQAELFADGLFVTCP